MPYHHNNGHRVRRVPRALIFIVATVASISLGVCTGQILAVQKAHSDYSSVVTAINQRYTGQLQRAAIQSELTPSIQSAQQQRLKAKTYKEALTAIDSLKQALAAYNKASLDECAGQAGYIATLDMHAVTSSKHIREDIRQSFNDIHSAAAENDVCKEDKQLVAYNNFSLFTLTVSTIISQIQATTPADPAALAALRTQLSQGPSTTDIATLKTAYGTDFGDYLTAYIAFIKNYETLITTEDQKAAAAIEKQLKTASDALSGLHDKALQAYQQATIKGVKEALTQAKDNYQDALTVNSLGIQTKLDTRLYAGAILVDAVNAYVAEQGSHPAGNTLSALLETLKAKNYIDATASFDELQYTYDPTTGIAKLTIPAENGRLTFTFVGTVTQPTSPSAQPLDIQTS